MSKEHPLRRRTLAAPRPAQPLPRHLLDPRTGWFRLLERRVSMFLSRYVFPHIPVLHFSSDAQIDRYLTLSTAQVTIPGLPAAWDGASALLIADIHAGPFLSRQTLERAFRRLGDLRPNLILLCGDFVTTELEELQDAVSAIRDLQATDGVFGVLGNHDHYTGRAEEVCSVLERLGVHMLQNRSIHLERDGQTFTLAGIDDLLLGEPDLDAALGDRRLDRPMILLSHHPDVFFDAVRQGVSLVVSGHTHGGQIRIPGLPVLVRMSRYRLDEGRYSFERGELIVTRGLGVVGLPFRIACPPEVVWLTLRAAPTD